MELLLQIGIVFGICFIGQIFESLLPFAFPASVLSMFLLFLVLKFGIIKTSHIDKKADFLLKNMSFFFIPAGVEIMNYFSILKSVLLPFILICIISTVLTFMASAYTVELIQIFIEKHGKNKQQDQIKEEKMV